jgi:hypothetical protein
MYGQRLGEDFRALSRAGFVSAMCVLTSSKNRFYPTAMRAGRANAAACSRVPAQPEDRQRKRRPDCRYCTVSLRVEAAARLGSVSSSTPFS